MIPKMLARLVHGFAGASVRGQATCRRKTTWPSMHVEVLELRLLLSGVHYGLHEHDDAHPPRGDAIHFEGTPVIGEGSRRL